MEIHKEGKYFLELINNPFKLKIFLLKKLPLALIAGVNLESANPTEAIASM
jgi:hypothetical protein